MRAISSFRREAGISTFWCRAWSAFRTRVSMSATGSVNLIVSFSSGHPFAPRMHGEPAAALLLKRNLGAVPNSHSSQLPASQQRTTEHSLLPGRLRNAWNLAAQRQSAEAQAAHSELAEKRARTSAQAAAVVPARGKLGPRLLGVAGQLKLLLDLRVFYSFCCRCQT